MHQLRIRSEYSFKKVYGTIERVVSRLKEIGAKSAGLVDIDSTWGHVPWFKLCKKEGIQPLLGVDLVVSDNETPTRMWFLAKNERGLRELYRTTSKAHLQKLGSRPRLYRSDVLAMSDDILKFAGDIVDESFLQSCGAIIDIDGDSLLLDSKKRDIKGCKFVKTCCNYYPYPEDRDVYNLMIPNGGKIKECSIQPIESGETEAWIVEQCSGLELPIAPIIHEEGDIEKICREGIAERGLNWTQEYEDRMMYEIGLIKQKNFDSYFIMVSDMVRHAKKYMLVGPSRGSSAGSLVCYLMRITEIDPIPSGLFFERFIDITRSDLPDIDIDFPDEKRHIVFEYMEEKYGKENVARIGTISRYKPKSSLIYASKELGVPSWEIEETKNAIIERSSADSRVGCCLEDTLKDTIVGKELLKKHPQLMLATKLEGHSSHTGVHAAGLIVCNESIRDYCTVDEEGIAHIDKHSAEAVGLLKIDVLGLRTLSILEDCNVGVDFYNLELEDQEALDIFNSGRFCGIFQFEGLALRSLSERIKFKSIQDIDAITALARPGPFSSGVVDKYIERKNGKPYKKLNPIAEEAMKDTFGLPLYQENTLALVRSIGKFTWEETTFIRKAVSKKYGAEAFEPFRKKFIENGVEQGLPSKEVEEIWNSLHAMGAWQMNRSHTRSYAVISYWTAYLKAHFPIQFAAANLRNAKDDDSALELLREFAKYGIKHSKFDPNRSELDWSVQDGKLLPGFLSIKGIGESKAKELLKLRDAGKLDEFKKAELLNMDSVFNSINKIHEKYGDMYVNPAKYNVGGEIVDLSEIAAGLPNLTQRLFIAEIVKKNVRDGNEDVNIKKRGGKVLTGNTIYIDLRMRDDTSTIQARVGMKDYLKIGVELTENIPVGAILLVRAIFYNGFRFAHILKWKRLDV